MEVIKEVKLYVMNPDGDLEKLTGSTFFRQMPDNKWEIVDLAKLAKITAAKQIIKRFCKELEAEMIAQLDKGCGGKANA